MSSNSNESGRAHQAIIIVPLGIIVLYLPYTETE